MKKLCTATGTYFFLNNPIELTNDFRFETTSGNIYVKKSTEYTISEPTQEEIKLEQSKIIKNIRRSFSRYSGNMGADPEILIINKRSKKVIPAPSFLNSKQDANNTLRDDGIGNVLNRNNSNKIYWDGFQAEFEVTPASCLAWVVDGVRMGLKSSLHYARMKTPNAELFPESTIDISPSQLRRAKDEHVEFGCMPSFNVYGIEGLKEQGRNVPFRSAGGHIHFGCGKLQEQEVINIVKALDFLVAIPCVSLFESFDDARRRYMYGLAGEYRLPPHGIEYRTLSSSWMIHPFIMNVVFELARIAFGLGRSGVSNMLDIDDTEVVNIINTTDVQKAREFMLKYKDLYIPLMQISSAEGKMIFDIMSSNVNETISDPRNIESNWNLFSEWRGHCEGVGKNIKGSISLLAKGELLC